MSYRPKILKVAKATIVLFHPEHEDLLQYMMPDKLRYVVFDPLKDTKYGIVALIHAIISFIREEGFAILKYFVPIPRLRKVFRRIRAHLIANQLRRLNPKAVITFIDNSGLFHHVCESYKEVPFLAIQNGSRSFWCASEALPDPTYKYHIDEYYCFGPYVKELFDRFGHNIKEYKFCGSFRGGLHFAEACDSIRDGSGKLYDICLISQWEDDFFHRPESLPRGWSRIGESIEVLTNLVSRYIKARGVNLCVVLRTNEDGEREFFTNRMGEQVIFQERIPESGSSYKAITLSNLTIVLNSTLGSEALGWGKKVLFVNPFGEEWLRPAREGLFSLASATYEDFSKRVTDLLSMELSEYQRITQADTNHLMAFNKAEPAHKIIRDRLLELTHQ